MNEARNTEGFPTLDEVDRSLTSHEAWQFELLDSPLGNVFAREYGALTEAGAETPEQDKRITLLRKFHVSMESKRHQAPREVSTRYITAKLEIWICNQQHLALDERVGLHDLLIEARDAYLESRGYA